MSVICRCGWAGSMGDGEGACQRRGSLKTFRPLSVANVPDFLLGIKRKNKKQTKNREKIEGSLQLEKRKEPPDKLPFFPTFCFRAALVGAVWTSSLTLLVLKARRRG